jgi:hypothetical protein
MPVRRPSRLAVPPARAQKPPHQSLVEGNRFSNLTTQAPGKCCAAKSASGLRSLDRIAPQDLILHKTMLSRRVLRLINSVAALKRGMLEAIPRDTLSYAEGSLPEERPQSC